MVLIVENNSNNLALAANSQTTPLANHITFDHSLCGAGRFFLRNDARCPPPAENSEKQLAEGGSGPLRFTNKRAKFKIGQKSPLKMNTTRRKAKQKTY